MDFDDGLCITCLGGGGSSNLSCIAIPSTRPIDVAFLTRIDPFLEFCIVGLWETLGPVVTNRCYTRIIRTNHCIRWLWKIQATFLTDNFATYIIAIMAIHKGFYINANAAFSGQNHDLRIEYPIL